MADLIRAFPLEADEVDVVGRRLEGRALAWDTLYRVTDDGVTFYEEGFRRGAAIESIRARRNWFEARDDHADVRVGYVGFSEADDGLMFAMTLDLTHDADEMLDHLRSASQGRRVDPLRAVEEPAPQWPAVVAQQDRASGTESHRPCAVRRCESRGDSSRPETTPRAP
jgi:hypothetical protein